MESVSGGAHWGGGVWMGSRDRTRFGLLYVNDGARDVRQLLSQDWIRQTCVPSEHNPMYGYLWGLRHDADGHEVSFAAPRRRRPPIDRHSRLRHGLRFGWRIASGWSFKRALPIVTDRAPLRPPKYVFEEVNAGVLPQA